MMLTPTSLRITAHAIERYQERVANVAEDAARAALSSPAVRLAARIGAAYVKLGTGQRVALQGSVVVTVLASRHAPHRRQLRDRAE